MAISYLTKPLKFDLKTRAALSSYRAHFTGAMAHLCFNENLTNEEFIRKLASMLNSWFMAEEHIFTDESTRLLPLLKDLQCKLEKIENGTTSFE